jgi:pantoate--beta-alanine ligase
VATVCTKLFMQTGADFAVFGEKDWQQFQVVRRVVRDLDLTVGIVGLPTVREADGLALSSRNRFLSPAERAVAPRLAMLMRQAADAMAGGAPVREALERATQALREAGFAPEYLALVEAESLRSIRALAPGQPARLIAAARLGTVRLLDNLAVRLAEP